jgi:hypothetical protein
MMPVAAANLSDAIVATVGYLEISGTVNRNAGRV